MTEPKIEFKNVKTFRGREGYGINADIYINGVKCLFLMDDANGGEYNYDEIRGKNPDLVVANIKLVDDYIAQLPEQTMTHGDRSFTIKVNRDIYFNDKLSEYELAKAKEKAKKKMEKLYVTAIVFGVPDSDRYQYISFKRPLSNLPTGYLQMQLNQLKKRCVAEGKQIFNTNLKTLGVTI